MPGDKFTDLLLCADDFGLSPGISQAVIELASLGKIDAASALVECPGHRDAASRLKQYYPRLQIGLHFNLTEAIVDEPFSLWKLICSPWLSRPVKHEISRRLETQLNLFEEHYGVTPDFVDGHRHVHMLPAVRELFLAQIARRFADFTPRPWIRLVNPYLTLTDARLKALLLRGLGVGFKASCDRYGLGTNRHFDGIYSLRPGARYAAFLEAWLSRAAPGTVIMCHPGRGMGTGSMDKSRLNEFTALAEGSGKEPTTPTA